MVLEALLKSAARLLTALSTPVRLAEVVGDWEAVAKADATLVSPVARL